MGGAERRGSGSPLDRAREVEGSVRSGLSLTSVFVFFYSFGDRVSHSPGCLQILCVAEDDLELLSTSFLGKNRDPS